jgi:hypothetical protein
MEFLFNHSGAIGDILYSLHFCKELNEYYKNKTFDFNIQTNVYDENLKYQSHPNKDKRMSDAAANYLKPVLEAQDYIKNVSMNDNVPMVLPGDTTKIINLDLFRAIPINFASGDIRRWYYNLIDVHLPADFSKPSIIVKNKNTTFKDKILLICTERYVNVTIDYNQLRQFKDKLVFIGLESEYNLFKNQYFDLEYCKTKNMLEAAELMAGAKGVLGNPSGLYTLAECMKVNRICITPEYFKYANKICPGPVNVHPIGGWHEAVALTQKLIFSINNILNI